MARIDHVLIGASDLTRGSEAVARRVGVTPGGGGKHPTGTENALLSLGDSTYLEVVAPQPGAFASSMRTVLKGFSQPTPFAWAVSGDDLERLRTKLKEAGFKLTAPEAGSRATPSGATLRWTGFGLEPDIEGAPFFIVWSPGTSHPAETSPHGCSLVSLTIGTPEEAALSRLTRALDLPVEVKPNPTFAMAVSFKCPAGVITFTNP